MARRRINTTKAEIIRVATGMFLEYGFDATSAKAICDQLDISTGNLTFYFPTKEHMLAELVEMLCRFQWEMMEQEAQDGVSSLMAICLELTAMAAMCEEDGIAKEIYLSAYSLPLTLEIIRRNDAKRAKEVFSEYCPDWTDEQFAEAETLVSGMEYATLMTTGDSAPLETRIAGALNQILTVYQVPEEIRRRKIERVLSMDYRGIGRRVFKEFRDYVKQSSEQLLQQGMEKEISNIIYI